MSIRTIGTVIAFLFVFLGLLSLVGDVAASEFYGCLALGAFAGLFAYMKLPNTKILDKGK